MTELEINTDKGHSDVDQQVREMSTSQLLDIYDLFERNPTVFTMVSNELMFRREHETELEHQVQIDKIERRLTR